jgi:MoaA/NifB/PqqE/SkfB family radical SAM enzyme
VQINYIIAKTVSNKLKEYIFKLLVRTLVIDWFRKFIFWFLALHFKNNSSKINAQRKLLYSAIIDTTNRLIAKRAISIETARKVASLWIKALRTPPHKIPAVVKFHREYNVDPPWFLTISPGHSCNLKCNGCYAASSLGGNKLEWPVLERVINEAKALWGIRLVVFSGGEPLLYHSHNKGVLDIVERNPDLLFLMFTNGTLINEKLATQLSKHGNLTPAFSVEGMQNRTDDRRGKGVFNIIKQKMKLLRQVGIPFGISATVTRDNYEEVLADEFLDLFFGELGAFYAFYFQYLPIGHQPNVESMPTPLQRLDFWRRVWNIIEEKRLFLVDFWNHGPLVNGCISAGRAGGYLCIDWNGDIMPCVFAPYSATNIHQVYGNGGTLNDVWALPFFQSIRNWQVNYGFGKQKLSTEGNWMSSCPFRDHYHMFRSWIDQYELEPEDESARLAMLDSHYSQQMTEYATKFRKLSQKIWNREYL